MKRSLLIVILAIILSVFLTSCKSSDYKRVENYKWDGNYAEAVEVYRQLGNYKDSPELLVEAMVAHVNTTSAKGQRSEALTLLEDYRETIGDENYGECLYNIGSDYCEGNTSRDYQLGFDTFKKIPESCSAYKSGQRRMQEYDALSVSPFVGHWSGEKYNAVVEHDYKIAVQVSLLYKKEFQLECSLKVMGEDYYIWVEDTFLYNADEATDKELGSGRTCSLKITSSGELKVNERGTLYYLTRG